VPAFTESFEESGPIEPQRTVEEVRQEPYPMPAGFKWCSVDIMDEVQVNEVYTLLTENYVEDDDNMFRFDYSIPFLKWALAVPGYHMDWHVGVRNETTGKLLAFITGIPARIRVHTEVNMMAEINFLCIHKKLRHKRLAPVLIKEVTRRVNLRNIWQAVYTAGVVLPKPVAKCRYWHRSINPKKLVEIRFTSMKDRMTMAQVRLTTHCCCCALESCMGISHCISLLTAMLPYHRLLCSCR
jgi:glycylpeptide N-tetradecanoyltransferase